MSSLADFHHQFYGPENGRRWVFLHGLMGFLNNWRKIISGIEASERVLVYDQRGHGRSIKPATGYAPEDYARDLKDILDELGWDKIILVGHSMGARNGLVFCDRWPERVEKFVLEDIGPDSPPSDSEYYRRLLGLVPTPFASREAARSFFQNEFATKMPMKEKAETLGAYFYANMTDQSDGTVTWRFSPDAILQSVDEGRKGDRWPELQRLKVPTLLIRGEDSPELTAATYARMLETNKMIHGVIVPKAGHWVHADQPQLVLNAIKQFVGGFEG